MTPERINFPDYDPLLPENTLYGDQYYARFGQFVLQHEAAYLGAEYDKAKHDANVDFLENHQDGWATAISGDTARGWSLAQYGTQDPIVAKQRAQQFSGDAHIRSETLHVNMRGSLSVLRSFVAALTDTEKQKLSQNIADQLSQYAQQQGIHSEDLAFANWKSQEEDELGKPLTWADWLSRAPVQETDSRMTKKDRQLLNFVQWNQHTFNAANADPQLRAEFDGHTLRLQSALHEAVQNGILDPQLYDNMLQKPVVAVTGEPIDLGLLNSHGYTRQGLPEIILPQKYTVATFNHEMIHQYGGFPDKFWNESAVQLISDEIDDIQGAPLHESAYETGMKAMRDMLKFANMGPRTLSKFYANRDYEGLIDALYERTTINFGRMYQDMKQQAMTAYPNDKAMSEGYLAYLMSEAVEDAINNY